MAHAALLKSLPRPSHITEDEPRSTISSQTAPPRASSSANPPYGKRNGFIPRRQEHFGDGGAYPECHVAQYPLDMGRKDTPKSNAVIPVTVDEQGQVNYDTIVKQGAGGALRDNKIVYSQHTDLVPKPELAKQTLERPDEEEAKAVAERTARALEKITNVKLAAAQPKTLAPAPGEPQYIKYTPSQQGEAFNSGGTARVIKMFEKPVDPLEPPKFKHKKVPKGSGSPPVPIMHSPPRVVTVQDQQDWKIPPCISNWKNAKGYTIPLDKRLAADGRGLQEVQINDGFAKLSEALYVAEQKAREAVEARSKMQKQVLMREKDRKEQELRALAQKARMERSGIPAAGSAPADVSGGGYGGSGANNIPMGEPRRAQADTRGRSPSPEFEARGGGRGGGSPEETREEREERRRRDEIREERRRERERERRLEAAEVHGGKKSKLTRDRERDISEKIALGQAHVGGTGEVQYDQRLFNQQEGLGSGLADEDAYNLYDKGLFQYKGSQLYQPKNVQDSELYGEGGKESEVRTDRFKPDKGWQGAQSTGPRSQPVQFERDAEEADPFGLDHFLTEVNKGRKATDVIGKGGGMAAGGGSMDKDAYASGSSRSRLDFARERG